MQLTLFTDQPVLVCGLKAALLAHGIEPVTVCSTYETLLSLLHLMNHPDMVLLDLSAGLTFGQLAELRKADPDLKLVLWVDSISTEFAYQAMSLGVRGILRKTLPTDLLCKCLEKVQEGELWFEKALTDDFLTAKRITLTRREGQLVTALSAGLSNKEIGYRLGITAGTVKVYLSRLFDKTGVENRFELALWAERNLASRGEARDDRDDPEAPVRSILIGPKKNPTQPDQARC